MDIRNRRVLITGASAGIGRATALLFAREGAIVFATARRLNKLQELAAEAQQQGHTIIPLVLDVTDQASIEAAMQTIREQTNGYGVDILINNAGYGLVGPLEETKLDTLRQQFETNVFGLVGVTQHIIPWMRQRRQGHIINVGSTVGQLTMPYAGPYAASKYAVEALSDAFRMELAQWNIKVSLIQPGPIATDFGTTASTQTALEVRSVYPNARKHMQVFENLESGSTPESVAQDILAVAKRSRPPARRKSPRHWGFIIGFVDLLPTGLADRGKRGLAHIYPQASALQLKMRKLRKQKK